MKTYIIMLLKILLGTFLTTPLCSMDNSEDLQPIQRSPGHLNLHGEFFSLVNKSRNESGIGSNSNYKIKIVEVLKKLQRKTDKSLNQGASPKTRIKKQLQEE